MCFSITDTFEAFILSLLSSLMISGPNSPFYKALIEPEIGSDFSSSVGYVVWQDYKISSSLWLLRVELYKCVVDTGLTAALDKRLSPSVFRAWRRTTLRRSNTSLLKPSMTSSRECWLGFYGFNAVRCFKLNQAFDCENLNWWSV